MHRAARLGLTAVAAGAFVFVAGNVVERLIWRGKVLPGVHLAGFDVSGRSVDAVRADVEQEAKRRETAPIAITAGPASFTLDPADVKLDLREADIVRRVSQAGRHGNPFGQLVGGAARLFRDDEVSWAPAYDDVALRKIVDQWVTSVARLGSHGDITFENGVVKTLPPKPGAVLSAATAFRLTSGALEAGTTTLTLPTTTAANEIAQAELDAAAAKARSLLSAPVTIRVEDQIVGLTPDKLSAALVAVPGDGGFDIKVDASRLTAALGINPDASVNAPRDASFEIDEDKNVRVVPSTPGRKLDVDQLADLVATGSRNIAAPFTTIEPEFTTDEANALGVKEVVASFTTRHPAGQPRVKNIHRIADLMQNRVIKPGERMSVNEAVGKRTTEKGFVQAPVIYSGEFTEDVGGGVSQFATTLFNAAWRGGYSVPEHQAHSVWISRYPKGIDATLSFPKPDLVIVNDGPSALLIHSEYTESSLTISLFGDKAGRQVKIDGPVITNEKVEVGIAYEVDPKLPTGKSKELEPAFKGFDVKWTRTITIPGQAPKTESMLTRYKAKKQLIAVGPGTPTTQPAGVSGASGASGASGSAGTSGASGSTGESGTGSTRSSTTKASTPSTTRPSTSSSGTATPTSALTA